VIFTGRKTLNFERAETVTAYSVLCKALTTCCQLETAGPGPGPGTVTVTAVTLRFFSLNSGTVGTVGTVGTKLAMDSWTSRMLEERIRSVRQALERDADAAVLRARYAPSVTTSHGEQFLVPRVLLMYVCEIIVLR